MPQAMRLLPGVLMGTQAWCELVEEADTDVRDLDTRAVRTEAGWRLEGTKVSNRIADVAERALVIARTDPNSRGTKGLSCFVVSLDASDVHVYPSEPVATSPQVEGRTVVFDGALVSDDDVVGTPQDGWNIARTILAHGEMSLAGRIRRGVITLMPGERAGFLDQRVADVLATHQPSPRRS